MVLKTNEVELLKTALEDMAKRVIMLEQFINSAARSEPAGTTTVGSLTNISDAQLDDNPVLYFEHADGGLMGYVSQLESRFKRSLAVADIPDLPASKITSEIFSQERLPTGTTVAKGIVQLSEATDSTSNAMAATPSALNALRTDLQNQISQNDTDIAANASSIVANASAITANASSIGTNATNINANATAIANLQNEVDAIETPASTWSDQAKDFETEYTNDAGKTIDVCVSLVRAATRSNSPVVFYVNDLPIHSMQDTAFGTGDAHVVYCRVPVGANYKLSASTSSWSKVGWQELR
ncbi:tail fiber protein [Vibrio parahaemolyticus]|uniref:tail fiber protein n=1 Tax=Vibrio parahaemolyticus TaxID=670 RepID=UPI002555C4EE|nr:tail fiber protein [Vibrio parahaemolyticus]